MKMFAFGTYTLKSTSKKLILLNYSKKIFSNYNHACLKDGCMLM